MYKPTIKPSQLGSYWPNTKDACMIKLGALIISVGNVYSLLLGNSGNSSRIINIATSNWDTYQEVSNYPGLAGSWVTTVNAIIRSRACLVAPDGQEKEFWKSAAGDRCTL